MNTIEKLNTLKDDDFLSREQAANLAEIAIKEYTRRSRAGKAVDRALYDMILAGGCPNAVRSAVGDLVDRYKSK